MDAGTGLTVLGTVLGSKELVVKILGPTADYLGSGLRDWTERKVSNVGRVFESAHRRLGAKIDTPGTVPPKILKGILEEGPFCDNELSAEYFGGVLAASRTSLGRDDRGAAITALLGRLSTYQIRSHYFFYNVIRTLFLGASDRIGDATGRLRLTTFVPAEAYVLAMEFDKSESVGGILNHVMFGLVREALIEDQFSFGPKASLKGYPVADSDGIVFVPSALGVELFMWAHGMADQPLDNILNPAVEFTSNVKLKSIGGFRSTVYKERMCPRDDGAPIKPTEPTSAAE